VSITVAQIQYRQIIVFIILTVLSVFWGSVVLGIYRVSTHLQQKLAAAHHIQGFSRAMASVAVNTLPPLLLLIIMQILPWIFFLISHKYERLKTHSEVSSMRSMEGKRSA